MSRVLEATCENNVVKVGDTAIDGVVILSQGKKSSAGILILDGENLTYVASNATDVAELIDTLNQMVTKLIAITTSLDAVTLSPGSAAANIALLTTMNTQLGLTKDNLK